MVPSMLTEHGKEFCVLTSDGALGGSSNRSSDGRASRLGDHLGGQTGGEDTSGGHCEDG